MHLSFGVAHSPRNEKTLYFELCLGSNVTKATGFIGENRQAVDTTILPLLCRSCDSSDKQVQEAGIKLIVQVAGKFMKPLCITTRL